MNYLERKKGIHFYINIKNFNQVVSAEEEATSVVNHSIHALDTYFSSIERYGKKHYRDVLTIEKITGARLHLYVTDDIVSAYDCVKNIVSYAYQLSKLINNKIPKYKTLKNFQIQVGAGFGCFYEFLFKHNDSKGIQDYGELTTIGYAANYAAKLQGLAGVSRICISEDIYKVITDDIEIYSRCEDERIEKYGQNCYNDASLSEISKAYNISDNELSEVIEYAKKVNLTDMRFVGVRNQLSFADLSKTSGKKITGIPLFADVRGFTSKFKDDDSNLEDMTVETERILTSMYNVTMKHGGIHVQFQGDREEVLFHDIGNELCLENAIFAGMRMIDAINKQGVHIGVGADYGTLYATKIGARGEKDNILIGKTVISADRLEDAKADINQIAISDDVYQRLLKIESSLVSFFKKNSKGTYVATVGYQEYLAEMESIQHRNITKKGDYNGAWRMFNG